MDYAKIFEPAGKVENWDEVTLDIDKDGNLSAHIINEKEGQDRTFPLGTSADNIESAYDYLTGLGILFDTEWW